MIEKLRVVDLMSGIGGRAKGFQRAGYDIVYSVDNLPIYKEICSQIIGRDKFILAEVEQIAPIDIPESDIITAKLIVSASTSIINRKAYEDKNDAIFRIIFEKMPKAFVLEIPSRMINGNKWVELKKF